MFSRTEDPEKEVAALKEFLFAPSENASAGKAEATRPGWSTEEEMALFTQATRTMKEGTTARV